MRLQFLFFAGLLLIGAVLAGYSSGYYEGVRKTRSEMHEFLKDFSSATEQESYLETRGQKDWSSKLGKYGIVGPTSYIHVQSSFSYLILAGIACVTVGIVGLLSFSRRLSPTVAN